MTVSAVARVQRMTPLPNALQERRRKIEAELTKPQ